MSLPAWLQAVLRLGVVSAIALWFVYRSTTAIETRLAHIEEELAEHAGVEAAQSAQQQRMYDLLAQHAMMMETWIAVTRQTCINTARSDDQRSSCAK